MTEELVELFIAFLVLWIPLTFWEWLKLWASDYEAALHKQTLENIDRLEEWNATHP